MILRVVRKTRKRYSRRGVRASREENLVAANARWIRNDECEYSHGRARNKALGENVRELFVAATRAEINDERERKRESGGMEGGRFMRE